MPETVEGHIWQALQDRIQVMDADIGLPIAWHTRNFNTPADRKYLRIQNFPNQVDRVRISSDEPDYRIGQLQISVHWPPNVFPNELEEMAGRVAAHWPKDLELWSGDVLVRVTSEPEPAGILVEDDGLQLPVTIYWWAQG